jgi:hypothetical protein
VTVKDALFRELKYNLCGAGGALDGILSPARVKLDARLSPSSERAEDDYPWLVFRLAKQTEDDPIRYATATVEIAVIGLRSSAAKGDDLLESIRGKLIDHFAGKRKTWGQFQEDGSPDDAQGLRMSCAYQDTVEALDATLMEKFYIMVFNFAYLRA